MDGSIEFQGKTYTQDALREMDDTALLELRNLVATNLGVARLTSFKDHDTAVEQTFKALTRYQEEMNKEQAAAADGAVAATPAPAGKKAGRATKTPEEREAEKARKAAERAANKPAPKERGLAKSAEAKFIKRPTRNMFATIHKIGEHNGSTHQRAHRWSNYKDGMTIADVIETEGTEPWDVQNWVGHGIMRVDEPTDEQYAERRKAWFAKHNMTDPEQAKVTAAKEREEAKTKREAEAAAKKAEREAAAQAKRDAAAAKAAEAPAAQDTVPPQGTTADPAPAEATA